MCCKPLIIKDLSRPIDIKEMLGFFIIFSPELGDTVDNWNKTRIFYDFRRFFEKALNLLLVENKPLS